MVNFNFQKLLDPSGRVSASESKPYMLSVDPNFLETCSKSVLGPKCSCTFLADKAIKAMRLIYFSLKQGLRLRELHRKQVTGM